MSIGRIELKNWKNFRKADVRMAERMFLVGPNASGKSNFLDAFRFLHDLAAPGGGLRRACDERDGVSKIRCLAARSDPEIGISVELSGDDKVAWRYEIYFNQQARGHRVPLVKRETVYAGGGLILERPDADDAKDELRLTQTALEQVNLNRSFRELAQFFQKIFYLHLVPQVVRSGNGAASQSGLGEAFGRNFLERVAQTNEKTRGARLRRVRDALVVAVPQLQELSLARDELGVPHLVGSYKHWRPQGARQNERHFSDGTLRLLGLLWALQEGDGPLLLEEPELSLHSGVVRRLPSLIYRLQRARRRQVIISTHSLELLMDLGIGGEETLMLTPSAEGTETHIANNIPEIRALLETGLSVAEAVLPHTEPEFVLSSRIGIAHPDACARRPSTTTADSGAGPTASSATRGTA
jgi:predicted ATPase